jgi:hypothetical protein
MTPEVADLLQRLESLEHKYARLAKASRRWRQGTVVVLLLAASAALLLLPGLGRVSLKCRTVEADVVLTHCLLVEAPPAVEGHESFFIHPKAGEARGAALYATSGEAVLELLGEHGGVAAELRVGRSNLPSLITTAAGQRDRATLELKGYDGKSGAGLAVTPGQGKNGDAHALFPITSLRFEDERGRPRAGLTQAGTDNPSFRLMDPAGKMLFARP